MKSIGIGFFAIAISALATPIAIVSATGPENGQDVANWIGETWTQTGTYNNVTISAMLNGGVALPSTANVYLMNWLGPGATAGSNQIAYELATLPAETHGITLFEGLTLSPGTYFLLADEVDAGWTGSSSPVYTTDAGVSNISSFSNSGPIAGYAPDTPYMLTSGAFLFSVTGTSSASTVPEPAAFGLILASLGCLLFAGTARIHAHVVTECLADFIERNAAGVIPHRD